jgi:tetrahydromethanopterin S-methyltransferase subunit F
LAGNPGTGGDQPSQAAIAQAIQDVSEKAQLLIREEIELAKTEVTQKVTTLVKGLVVGAAAGMFLVVALLFALHGFAWLAWYALPVGQNSIFWGYFVVAGVLILLGAIAGFLAYRAVRKSAPPTPVMAIDEARRIKETVSSSDPGRTI